MIQIRPSNRRTGTIRRTTLGLRSDRNPTPGCAAILVALPQRLKSESRSIWLQASLTSLLHGDAVHIYSYALGSLITGQYCSIQQCQSKERDELEMGITPVERTSQNIREVSKNGQTAASASVILFVACGSDVLSGVYTLS